MERSDVLDVGEKDALIPHQKTLQIARSTVKNLESVHILKDIGHGIELSKTYHR